MLGRKNSLIRSKIIYTLMIISIYLVGKGVPLYMIDVSSYMEKRMNAETLLMQTLAGDINQCSIFALGITPYMISSVLVQIVVAFRGSEYRKKISPIQINKMVIYLTLISAIFMAIIRINTLEFNVIDKNLFVIKVIVVIEMVAGVMLIIYLSSRNKKFGIGGQSVLIFVNIVEGILESVSEHTHNQLIIPMFIALVVMIIMIIMENSEMRSAVQRISIHSIYADKNYLAIKLNPIGVMPAMFSVAFFGIAQFLMGVFGKLLEESFIIRWMNENMMLNKPFGVVVYVIILYVMTIVFSRIMLNPTEMTEQFLKSGDSIRDLHAGRETKKYLSRVITILGITSAMVMSICLCIPLILQLNGIIEQTLMMLPSSVMILTGVGCSLCSEVVAIKDLEAYKPFI